MKSTSASPPALVQYPEHESSLHRDVRRLCHLFGVESWTDGGILTHSLHTAIIDREGRLAVNIDGNQFTVQELGDLVEAQMRRAH